tara:strand:+ start:2258 stop:3580 length:1323 start_codon:yes stop_codon:yes gene_type:complete
LDSTLLTLILVFSLLGSVLIGIPVVISLGLSSFLGLAYIMGNYDIAGSLLSSSAYGAIKSYVFATIPLFVLLGEILSKSGAASDLFRIVDRTCSRLPGRLALATVGGNTVFGAVTGVSIASAATFSRIAYPEMVRANYNKSIALGSIAGSAALGMLIPPSILLIVWGVIAGESIGRLFVAGVVPGLLLASMFFLFLLTYAYLKPQKFGDSGRGDSPQLKNPITRHEIIGASGLLMLIILVLGGIWSGFFTPTEAAGVGVLLAIIVGLVKKMSLKDFAAAVLNTGRVSAPLLFLLITAQMYSRLLANGGIIDVIGQLFFGISESPYLVLAIMVVIWLLLGMFLDSVSIILLTVPIFSPIAIAAGIDPLAFAIIGILSIEAGLLTPPFGMCVYTVKGAVTDPEVTLAKIFTGAIPYWIMLLSLVLIVAIFPTIASWLPALML